MTDAPENHAAAELPEAGLPEAELPEAGLPEAGVPQAVSEAGSEADSELGETELGEAELREVELARAERDGDVASVVEPVAGGELPGARADEYPVVTDGDVPPSPESGSDGAERSAAVPAPRGGGSGRPRQTLALVTPEEVRPALEAILLVVDTPVAEVVLAQILERPTEEITAVLEALAVEYREQGRGFDLRRAAGGWRLYTRDEFAQYVERFVLDGQHARLTQAALETLAVVAYKQPVTRSRISAIRGVAVDGVIRTLLTRGLIEECGAEPDTGAHLYRTTLLFLEKLGLDSLDELPPLAPLLPDLDSLDDVFSSS